MVYFTDLVAVRRFGRSYQVTKHWYAFGEYEYTDNDADLETFSYENNQVMLGIGSDF